MWKPKNVTDEYKCNLGYDNAYLEMTYNQLLSKYYDIYDIRKELFGKDSSGIDTYYYVIEPSEYEHTILLSAGMNCCELSSIFGLAYFIKGIMEENVYNLREEVRFIVLPILCPSSFNMNPKQYLNYNDVRINKNFNHNNSWDTVRVDIMGSKGEYPDSEIESINLKKWLKLYKNSDLWIDCHCDLESIGYVLFNTYVSDCTTLSKISKAQRDIKKYYIAKNYTVDNIVIDNFHILDIYNYIEDGTKFPKTLYAYEVENIPSIMIEQHAGCTLYGATGIQQCEAKSIQNYSTMLAEYCKVMIS